MTEFDRGWNEAMLFIAKWMDAAKNVSTDYPSAKAIKLIREEIAIIARDQIREPK